MSIMYSKLKFGKKLSNFVRLLPYSAQVKFYSKARLYFLHEYANHEIANPVSIDFGGFETNLWGINFRAPLINAAGMFKNGECYDISYKQGAGGYLLGTTTSNPRAGNTKHDIYLPSVMLPSSNAAINFLGLPNLGDQVIIHNISKYNSYKNFPFGVSLMRSPDYSECQGLELLVESLFEYNGLELVQFIELNESCPNVKSGDNSRLLARLSYISEQFIKKRTIRKPIILKLSNDLELRNLSDILEAVVRCGFSGLTLGNTVTEYSNYQNQLTRADRELMHYFTQNFGGGLSGAPLWDKSLELIRGASQLLQNIKPEQEFHLIQCGGIDSATKVRQSLDAGASLCQWYTGYFESLAKYGDNIYKNIYK